MPRPLIAFCQTRAPPPCPLLIAAPWPRAPHAALPAGKPRYVMGVGYPLDVVVCSALGADMYDRWVRVNACFG